MEGSLKERAEARLPLIIYGTGQRAPRELQIVTEVEKLNPVAFCSKNPNDRGKIFLGLPNLSKEEVRQQFGDEFAVWISPAPPVKVEIYRELISEGFVTKERILNYSPENLYKSCKRLHESIFMLEYGISPCCGTGNVRPVPWTIWQEGGLAETFEMFMHTKEKLIEDIRSGLPNCCDGCPELTESSWPTQHQTNIVNIGFSFPCQLSCAYCEIPGNARNIKENPAPKSYIEQFRIPEIIHWLEENHYFKNWQNRPPCDLPRFL